VAGYGHSSKAVSVSRGYLGLNIIQGRLERRECGGSKTALLECSAFEGCLD
jgi:hypothetical protein